MNKAVYDEGVKHLLKVEPNFKKILPEKEINFFARPQGFAGILHLVIEQQVSVQSAIADWTETCCSITRCNIPAKP